MGLMQSLRRARMRIVSHEESLQFLRVVTKACVKPPGKTITPPTKEYKTVIIVGRHQADSATIFANAIQRHVGDGMFYQFKLLPPMKKSVTVNLAELASVMQWRGGEEAADWVKHRLRELDQLPWPIDGRVAP